MTMHSFNTGAAVTVIDNAWIGQTAEVMIGIAAALLVLRLELQRRSGERGIGFDITSGMASCKQLLRQCSPEVAGIIACLSLAALFRARGDTKNIDDPAWENIKAEWPLLLGADTLLSLQAMLRIVVFFSGAVRSELGPVPLTDEVALLSLGAYSIRALLLARVTSYMLDGPLGGNLPAVFEAAAIPLLIAIGGLRTLRRSPLIVAIIVCCVGWLSSRHHLSFSEDTFADKLFVAAHIFDVLSAGTYLVRSTYIGNREDGSGVAVGFTHVLMITQSSLSAYYFLNAFDENPELIRAGHPFQILQIGNVIQCGAYLVATALFIAECFEGPTASDLPTALLPRQNRASNMAEVVEPTTTNATVIDRQLKLPRANAMVL